MDRFYVTDCEGPLSINDNAYEIADFFLPDGGKFFSILSNYDDILVEKQIPNYMAGSTLRLILPFFKAYALTERDLIEFSEDHIHMIDGAYTTIKYVQQLMPSYIVSTSYNQYIEALCTKTGFNYDNTYSTLLKLDMYELNMDDQDKLLDIYQNILFDSSFENLNHIFNDVIAKMPINKLIESVKPVGGIGKRDAIEDIIKKNNYKPENLMYSGDSITDVEALEYANENDGIAISFNGNIHSISAANISIASDSNLILALIANIFKDNSKAGVYEFIYEYNNDPLGAILSNMDDNYITQQLLLSKPSIKLVDENKIDNLVDESKQTRNKVRGQNIANLG